MISTKIVKINPSKPEIEPILEAAEIIRRGGLVIMPTETVYGIAANMLNKKTISRLYEVKQRPKSKNFSLHIADKSTVDEYAKDIPIGAYKLMEKFWPGPLTLVLKSKENSSIGIRMPDNDIALRLISAASVPVVCPSANISGKSAPIDFQQAIMDLEGKVDFAIDAGRVKLAVESSVVDFTSGQPFRLLREGALKKDELEAAAKKKTVLFICTGNSCRSVMAEALLTHKLKEKNRQDVEVLSRGIMMCGGIEASSETKKILFREGIDVSRHRSRRVDRDTVRRSDIILVMEKLHEDKILELAPEAKNRVFLLREFAKINVSNGDLGIADPVGRSSDFYNQVFGLIKESIERIEQII